MKPNRRQFIAGAAVGTTGAAIGLGVAGCNWEQVAINDIPVVLKGVVAVISIIGAAQGSAEAGAIAEANSLAGQVQTDLNLANQLIQGYHSGGSALTNIDNALNDALTNLTGITAALHIANPVLAGELATGVGGAIILLTTIISLVPPPATPAPTTTPAVTAKYAAKPRALDAFTRASLYKASQSKDHALVIRTGWNLAMTAAGGPQYSI